MEANRRGGESGPASVQQGRRHSGKTDRQTDDSYIIARYSAYVVSDVNVDFVVRKCVDNLLDVIQPGSVEQF